MGILGLTTFIDDNQHLLSDCSLCDVPIIIDGNNLYHFLYYYFGVSHQYGGDYDAFAAKIRYFFTTLQKCRITPHVIFDGAYDLDDRKLATALRRAKDRMHLAYMLSHLGRGKILPINAYSVFLSVLDEMKISHVTCDFEADGEIASLANTMRCPVMTNDSDFFIYDIKEGVVLIDYFNLRVFHSEKHSSMEADEEHTGGYYLKVQKYYFRTFHRQFPGMDKRLIPLFATLMGSENIDGRKLEPFFSSVRLPKSSSNKMFTSKKHSRMLGLLLWLERAGTYTTALENILVHFKKEMRPAIEQSITNSVEGYSNPSSKLQNYLMSFELECDMRCLDSSVCTYNGRELPGWLLLYLRNGQLPSFLINALVRHQVILLAQVEMMSHPSSYQCALPLRRLIYGIILSYEHNNSREMSIDACDTDHGQNRASSKRCDIVEEIDREGKTQKRQVITPLYSLPRGEHLPRLDEIHDLSAEQRLQCFHLALEVDPRVMEGIPGDLKFVMACIAFWVNHAEPHVTECHLYALLACLFKLGAIDDLATNYVETSNAVTDTALPSEHIDPQMVSCLTLQDLIRDNCAATAIKEAAKTFKEFVHTPKHKYTQDFDAVTVHIFSQFQTCVQAAAVLNTLLQCPVEVVSPDRFFSGTFLYNFQRELKSRKDPELYIEELLNRKTFLSRLWQYLRQRIMSICSPNRLDQHKPGTKGRKKKQKISKGQGHQISASQLGNNDGDKDLGNDSDDNALKSAVSESTVLSECFDTNKFACLHVD